MALYRNTLSPFKMVILWSFIDLNFYQGYLIVLNDTASIILTNLIIDIDLFFIRIYSFKSSSIIHSERSEDVNFHDLLRFENNFSTYIGIYLIMQVLTIFSAYRIQYFLKTRRIFKSLQSTLCMKKTKQSILY